MGNSERFEVIVGSEQKLPGKLFDADGVASTALDKETFVLRLKDRDDIDHVLDQLRVRRKLGATQRASTKTYEHKGALGPDGIFYDNGEYSIGGVFHRKGINPKLKDSGLVMSTAKRLVSSSRGRHKRQKDKKQMTRVISRQVSITDESERYEVVQSEGGRKASDKKNRSVIQMYEGSSSFDAPRPPRPIQPRKKRSDSRRKKNCSRTFQNNRDNSENSSSQGSIIIVSREFGSESDDFVSAKRRTESRTTRTCCHERDGESIVSKRGLRGTSKNYDRITATSPTRQSHLRTQSMAGRQGQTKLDRNSSRQSHLRTQSMAGRQGQTELDRNSSRTRFHSRSQSAARAEPVVIRSRSIGNHLTQATQPIVPDNPFAYLTDKDRMGSYTTCDGGTVNTHAGGTLGTSVSMLGNNTNYQGSPDVSVSQLKWPRTLRAAATTAGGQTVGLSSLSHQSYDAKGPVQGPVTSKHYSNTYYTGQRTDLRGYPSNLGTSTYDYDAKRVGTASVGTTGRGLMDLALTQGCIQPINVPVEHRDLIREVEQQMTDQGKYGRAYIDDEGAVVFESLIGVEVLEEKIRKVPVKKVVETTRTIPKVEVVEVQKRVQVPTIEYVDRIIEVEKIVEKIIEIPRRHVVEVPREVIREVPKIITVDRTVRQEVPGDIIEVEKPYDVHRKEYRNVYHDTEVPFEVKGGSTAVICNSDDFCVDTTNYIIDPVLYPVDFYVPVPRKSKFIDGGKETRHFHIEDEKLTNSLLRKCHPGLSENDLVSLFTPSANGSLNFYDEKTLEEVYGPRMLEQLPSDVQTQHEKMIWLESHIRPANRGNKPQLEL